ncbi:YecA family protein [Cytobacillus oceanisediminis]|uniref:YecA family protein n=1 Tax=Cytobacillus oceanisediminis TaxID=665099 RepID=UPI0011A4065B|nr:SEC-C metal-binding domain-containing protein [Cytobacillus oceanisediminis]
MSKIDEKNKNLMNALEDLGVSYRQFGKMEKKFWKKAEAPVRLIDVLSVLTKVELDAIRKQLELGGMSTLKKAELAAELAQVIPAHLERVLSIFDQEMYNLIKKLIKKSGLLPIEDVSLDYNINSLMNLGIVFPVMLNGQKQYAMPVELLDQFKQIDQAKLQECIQRNSEWIRLIHGMTYYYGVIESSKMIDKLEDLTKNEVDIRKYSQVVRLASDYYQLMGVYYHRLDGYLVDESINNVEEIIEEHRSRPDVDYYPFTKKQFFIAGQPGFIDKSPEMVKFLRFLSESYDMTAEDKDEIAEALIYMINSNDPPSKLIEYLQSALEFPTFEFVQQLTAHVMEVYNNTRKWALKGYKPTELRKERENHLKSKPAHPFLQPHSPSNVIDFSTRQKVGRNDPCPCGSGKKYKKCCGK